MKQILICAIFFATVIVACQKPAVQQKIDLKGEWAFAIDSLDKGISEKWFNQELADKVTLPGSMTTNGKGNDITLKTPWTGQIVDSSYFKKPEYAKFRQPGNIKIPFWLQPVKYYKGAAWYQKEVSIPEDWNRQSIGLFLERCHWESRLWVDDKEVGMQNSLGTPHKYDLTKFLTPGKHRLSLCVDNRVKDIDPGINSHSISDHTQSNWNGVVGQLFLEARPLIYIQNVQVYPEIQNKKIAVKVKVENPTGKVASVKLSLKIKETGTSIDEKFELKEGENMLAIDLEMGSDVKLWNEFHPNLYSLEVSLNDKTSGKTDVTTTTFGMREFKTSGKHILINGQPTFLRGTLECAIFPKTGYPATDLNEWLRIFTVAHAHGLNHFRFHSWCPPQAAFGAADQLGFYLHVECSSWANQSTTIGDGKPFDKYLYEESQRMIDEYGNHPSFCMMVYGNEPAGKNQGTFLTDFVNFWKSKDNRRIYTSGAGWPNLPANDYLSDSEPRIQHWGQGLGSIINAQAPNTEYDWSAYNNKFPQPMVSHEIGQWCVYPNFKEIAKYDGVLKAKNFELFQETLKDHGLAQLADSFLLASGKLQALCYKADIEAALRTKDFGGFQLLDLHDFPGQGSALVGVLDPFWGEKGYISPAEYNRFCNSTVALARMKKLVYTNDETFEAAIEVAHYGDHPISACVPEWKITDKTGKLIQSGKLPQTNIPVGNGFKLGDVSFPLAAISNPEKLILEVSVNGKSNSWDFWVYPAKKEIISGEEKIRVVQKLDAATQKYLQDGGIVLLNLKKGALSKELGGDIPIGFSSIFWNTAWTNGQAPHTLGILVNPNHPALAEFPTEYHSNYQWWDAMSHSGAINMTSFPTNLKPIVRVIDDWFTNRPLALIVEGKVGKGKILISGIDLTTDLDKRPEAQQMLFSLKKYMAGEKFQPKIELGTELLGSLTK
ncbi:beta-galactosidase [Aquipluma nitroreducens]|uniref:beta-galactosidase n=1 Tax=Aquipluma nitroreducens TaxID=2010828 RepID=A0A5K7SDF7_9BACT|nr:sugar-binding domain-containing protein [Aquipluma nitroreducens]BBE19496.1 beta-galactosidase [Aquipluma nitroreducens]